MGAKMIREVSIRGWGGDAPLDVPEQKAAPEVTETFDLPVVRMPELKPGQSVSVRVKWSRPYDDTPGHALFRLMSKVRWDRDLAWSEIGPDARAAFEGLAGKIRGEK